MRVEFSDGESGGRIFGFSNNKRIVGTLKYSDYEAMKWCHHSSERSNVDFADLIVVLPIKYLLLMLMVLTYKN